MKIDRVDVPKSPKYYKNELLPGKRWTGEDEMEQERQDRAGGRKRRRKTGDEKDE
jgi:hypothetical protein